MHTERFSYACPLSGLGATISEGILAEPIARVQSYAAQFLALKWPLLQLAQAQPGMSLGGQLVTVRDIEQAVSLYNQQLDLEGQVQAALSEISAIQSGAVTDPLQLTTDAASFLGLAGVMAAHTYSAQNLTGRFGLSAGSGVSTGGLMVAAVVGVGAFMWFRARRGRRR